MPQPPSAARPSAEPDPGARRVAVVLNPAAGSGRAGRARIAEAARRAGLAVDVHATGGPGEAARLARALAPTAAAVLAAGGDGTIHEVAGALAGTGARMGMLALGTGNDLAGALGVPRDVGAALAAVARDLAAGRARAVDAGVVRWAERADGGALVVRERVFANCLGAGFDALAAAGAGRSKWLGGRAAYLAAVAGALWTYRRPLAHVEVAVSAAVPVAVGGESEPPGRPEPALPDDGDAGPGAHVVFRGPIFLVEVGNGTSIGGGFRLTPRAALDDGLLDVCLAEHMTPARALRVLPTAFSGTHGRFPEVREARAARVVVRAVSGVLPLQADGEALSNGAHALAAEAWPGALRVVGAGGSQAGA